MPVVPKGGKASTGTLSKQHAQELIDQAAYRDDLNDLPPANSNDSARLHRRVHVKHNPSLEKLFKALGLDL